jgi:glycosyltransferase involved in cell wall biosynthesis
MEKYPKQFLISVIIPAHNEEAYIEKTLISIINSSYKDYEIIVICDSCIDKTEEISKKYTEKVYCVDFHNTSESRNYGASFAKGDIFVFSDADTICSDNYLRSISDVILSGFEYGCSRIVSETGTLKGRFMIGRFNKFNKKDKTFGGNCFIKEDFFKKMNGFDNDMLKGEDTDLGERLRKNRAKYIYIKNAYIITSERRFLKDGYLNYIIHSFKDAFLYTFFKEKYKKIYNKK